MAEYTMQELEKKKKLELFNIAASMSLHVPIAGTTKEALISIIGKATGLLPADGSTPLDDDTSAMIRTVEEHIRKGQVAQPDYAPRQDNPKAALGWLGDPNYPIFLGYGHAPGEFEYPLMLIRNDPGTHCNVYVRADVYGGAK